VAPYFFGWVTPANIMAMANSNCQSSGRPSLLSRRDGAVMHSALAAISHTPAEAAVAPAMAMPPRPEVVPPPSELVCDEDLESEGDFNSGIVME
jgi:hypothetical protein